MEGDSKWPRKVFEGLDDRLNMSDEKSNSKASTPPAGSQPGLRTGSQLPLPASPTPRGQKDPLLAPDARCGQPQAQ